MTNAGTASPPKPRPTHYRQQLGRDLETVLAVMAPRGPVVLVGHSMGGMTVLSPPGSIRTAIPPASSVLR